MKTSWKIVGLSAGAVLVAAVSISGVSAYAGSGSQAGQGNEHMGQGGMGQGGMGQGGTGHEDTVDINTLSSATLTPAQRDGLVLVAQDEKLAHDLYVTLGEKYPTLRQFQNIPKSEIQHLEYVRTLLAKYSITDPTKDQPAGVFTDKTVQGLYDKLLAEGNVNAEQALKSGVAVETADIASINAAAKDVTAEDVKYVYKLLLQGSERHLQAFSRSGTDGGQHNGMNPSGSARMGGRNV